MSSLERNVGTELFSALLAPDRGLRNIVSAADEISQLDLAGRRAISIQPCVRGGVGREVSERELYNLALTDDLTRLYNRRGFFAAAVQQLKLAHRNAQSVLLLFCDLDGLKKINDSFGHREGDLALVRVAHALENVFRDSDVLARIGGDEFAVLALDTSSQNLEVILRRLGKSLKKVSARELRYRLSISVGAARFDPQRPISLVELMVQADRAMYEEKRSRQGLCGD